MSDDRIIQIPLSTLEALAERAGERGGKTAVAEAFERIGLNDENAGRDVRELRAWVMSCRKVRDSMLTSIGRVIIFLVVAGLAIVFGKHYTGGAH